MGGYMRLARLRLWLERASVVGGGVCAVVGAIKGVELGSLGLGSMAVSVGYPKG